MAFIRAPHSRASMPPASLAPPRQQLACATSQPSRKPAAAIRALPANPSIALDPALPESCRYGTSVRGAAIAVGAPAARVPPTGKKTRKGKKQRGNLAKAKVKAAQVQQAEEEEEEERGSVDVVWVPDGHGGSRRVHLSKFRTLMLDSSYRPVSVINWQKAMVLEWMQKVDVLEYYSDVSVASASDSFPLPAVMRCRVYVQKPRRRGARMLVSKRNILLRDRHTCQYCGSRSELTIDHVVPVSKGGELSWSNCVTACRSCNAKKGSKTLQQLGWTTKQIPCEPKPHELAPLRLVPKVAMEVQSAEAHPWETYVSPFLQSYSTAVSRP